MEVYLSGVIIYHTNMRYKIDNEILNQYFDKIINIYKSWTRLANDFSIKQRTLQYWRRGRNTIPDNFINAVKKKCNIAPERYTIVDDNWSKKEAGKIGGVMRNRMYGNPGTKEGRIKGGTLSYKKQVESGNSPFNRIPVKIPRKSKLYAEFIGILLGDGGVSERQINIHLNKVDDYNYAIYVKGMIKSLFNIDTKIVPRKDVGVSILTISRTDLVNHFKKVYGIFGNKVQKQIGVPMWVVKNANYRNACLRGLVDTDGCFYIDSHRYNKKIYKNMGINFSNRSIPLLNFVKETMHKNGWKPSLTSPNAIVLRREDDILEYMSIIGTSNQKIKMKFDKYMEEYRSGHNGTVSKTV